MIKNYNCCYLLVSLAISTDYGKLISFRIDEVLH